MLLPGSGQKLMGLGRTKVKVLNAHYVLVALMPEAQSDWSRSSSKPSPSFKGSGVLAHATIAGNLPAGRKENPYVCRIERF